MPLPSIRTYVIRSDLGSAPNFQPPAATLVICKPRLRRNAVAGDLVIAFNGAEVEEPNRVVRTLDPDSIRWAGIVSEVLPLAAYWQDPRFAGKKPAGSATPDNLYAPTPAGLEQIPNPVHDTRHAAADIHGRNALIFGRSWYFGSVGPTPPPELERLRQRARRALPRHPFDPRVVQWLAEQRTIEPPLVSTDGRGCHSSRNAAFGRARPRC